MKQRRGLAALRSDGWIESELASCKFHDERHGKRLRKLLGQLSDHIGGSIPWASQDWANTKAAYRFFSNVRISEAEILGGHFQATRGRIAACDALILMLHDTTEFTFHRHDVAPVGILKVLHAQEQEGAPIALHGLRHLDALQLGGNERRASLGVGCDQVLDAR